VMNAVTQTLDEIPVKVKQEQQATEVQDNVLIINQVITTSHAESGTELPLYGLTEVLGVERSKREYVPGYGDMERSGQFSFPGDMEQKSYFLWIPTAGRPLEAKFTGEEDFHGLKVFTFEINEQDLDIGIYEAANMPQVLDISVNMKVEPLSGTTVYSESLTTIKVVATPDMKVAVYVSDIRFTDDTIADLVDTAKSARTALLTKWPVYISSLIFTDDTMTDLLDIAESARTQLLWARVYGFWLCLGLGIVLTLVGAVGIIRSRPREAA